MAGMQFGWTEALPVAAIDVIGADTVGTSCGRGGHTAEKATMTDSSSPDTTQSADFGTRDRVVAMPRKALWNRLFVAMVFRIKDYFLTCQIVGETRRQDARCDRNPFLPEPRAIAPRDRTEVGIDRRPVFFHGFPGGRYAVLWISPGERRDPSRETRLRPFTDQLGMRLDIAS